MRNAGVVCAPLVAPRVMVRPTHLLAVDGGGSGCRAVLADLSGRVLARADGGPANVSSDFDLALGSLRAVAADVLSDVPPAAVVAHMGLAGVLSASSGASVAQAFEFAHCTVGDDRETMLAGALGQRDGVLLALGTGSIMAARFGSAVRNVSGWGLQVSDQASGAWLGRALLQRVLLCHDGMMAHSELSRAMLDEMGGAVGIVRFASAAGAADYAGLAPRIVASPDDSVARALMSEGAAFLLSAVDVLDPAGTGMICLTGGIGPHYAPWLPEALQARLVAPLGSALDGALVIAQRAAEALPQ